jgi:nitrite reductase (NADH) large subunit
MNRASHKTSHVIIGNSAGALTAMAAIRENDQDASITLISAESCWAYSPVLLTYYMAGRISRDQVFLTDAGYYERIGVSLKLGDRATAVDSRSRCVSLESGETISYDRLLLATGSSAKQMGLENDDLPGIFTVKTLADADRILSYTAERKQIAILGGGLVGLQTANALAETDREITLIIGSDQPLSQNVDGECSRFITKSIQQRGLSTLFDTRVQRIEPDKGKLVLHLNTGKLLVVDAAIVGKGVIPNTELAKTAGIDVDWGILVDDRMRTSVPGVFAAGDVAQGVNMATGESQVVATWVNACVQGKTAGINMSGGEASCSGLNGNVCSILGNSVASVGITRPDAKRHYSKSHTDPGGKYYRSIIFDDNDSIVGAVLMGEVSDIGVLRNLVLNGGHVSRRIRKRIVKGPISFGDLYGCRVGGVV